MSTEGLLEELEARHAVRLHDGLQVLGPAALLRRPFDPGLPLLLLPDRSDDIARDSGPKDDPGASPFDPPVLPGRAAHGSDAAALLRALYPPDHPVLGVGGAPDASVSDLTASDLATGAHLVPSLEGEANAASPHGLPWLVARLRAPGGCPWDREQTHQSLRKFLLEEAYEVYDALEAGSTPALAEELGDLLLQVVLHALYAEEEGVFDLTDVYSGIMTKIVRRHPHVFGDAVAKTAEDVLRNWETIKADERSARTRVGGDTTDAGGSVTESTSPGARTIPATASVEPEIAAAFAGLSRSLPALLYAQEMQERAASLGYDWPDMEGVIDKLEEEAVELLQATDQRQREEEYGDLLLVVVNLGRKLGIDAEAALRAASRKFGRRFARVERLAAEQGVELRALAFEELDDLWRTAKLQAEAPAGSPGEVRA